MSTQQHLNVLKELNQKLEPWLKTEHGFSEVKDIIVLQGLFEQKLDRFAHEEQVLNIAIMGQVKAGKSSFLNALLFEGKQVLPTAATPKTANLTRISYGSKPSLLVEYYTPEEWQAIEKIAEQFKGVHDTEDVKVAKELVDMVFARGVDVHTLLQQSIHRIESETVDELMGELNQYAGNDGQLTALVKMTSLFLPIDSLKGFNIIDTPGMNDPVISRTVKTREEMSRCDVVFFLSRAEAFLDQSDIHLITSQLPDGGAKRLVLVAGKYDSVIDDDGYHQPSLTACENNIQKRLYRRTQVEIGKMADQREKAGRLEAAELLRQITTPVLSSTFAYGFANWKQSQWTVSMQHSYKQLMAMAQDCWNGYQFNQEDWLRISGFEVLRQAYQLARQDKQLIIQAQRDGILPEARQLLEERRNNLQEAVKQRMYLLEHEDLNSLGRQQQDFEQRIARVSEKLEALINIQLDKIKASSKDIEQSLQQEVGRYGLRTRKGTETEEESYTVSSSTWYKPWTWGDTETRYRTITTKYEYVSASDAVEQISRYARTCKNDIQREFNRLISTNQLKSELRRKLGEELKQSNENFKAAQFKHTLDRAISELVIPQLDLEIADAASQLSRHFSGEVRSANDIQKLKKQFNQALQEVFSSLLKRFNEASKQLVNVLTQTRKNLQHDLTATVRGELEHVRRDFHNKQQVLLEYQQLLDIVQEKNHECIA